MKIAILGTRGIPARYGGFETFAEEISRRLCERGHDVTVFCEADGRAPQPPFHGDVALKHVAVPPCGPLRTIAYDAASLWHARCGFDVVYMLGYGSSAFCWLPRLSGSEVWINLDGLEWARSKWGFAGRTWLRLMERLAMLTPTRVIADAQAIRTHLEQRCRRMPPCSVIPYGSELVDEVDPAPLARWALEPRGYYLVVCRFEPENHVLEIVQGYSQSNAKKPLLLVGDIHAPTAYNRRLRAIDDPRVCFIGTVYEKRVINALRFHCAAYLHGHSVGGTNPSLLEAMACGNVVIAHDNVFNREVLGDAGIYFADIDGFAAILSDLEGACVDTVALGDAAKSRAGRLYSWEQITEAYCALLGAERWDSAKATSAHPAVTLWSK